MILTAWTAGVRRLGTAVGSGIMGKTRGVILQSVCRRMYVHIRVGSREYYTRAYCNIVNRCMMKCD